MSTSGSGNGAVTKGNRRPRRPATSVAASDIVEPVQSPAAAAEAQEPPRESAVLSSPAPVSKRGWGWLLLLLLPALGLAFDSYQLFPIGGIDSFVYLGFFRNL